MNILLNARDKLFGDLRRRDGNQFSLIRDIEWIQAEYFAGAFDLFAHGNKIFTKPVFLRLYLVKITYKTGGNQCIMRNLPCPVIFALVITSLLFDVACFNSRRPSLQIRLRQLSSGDATHRSTVAFHLLDVDPIHLVMNGELESTPQGGEVYKEHPKLKTLAGKLNARRFGGYSLSPDAFLFLDQSRPLWESHVIKSGQTDATGNAVLDDLAKGTYWLVAYSRASGEEAFWVQQIDIQEGATEVELLRSNALYFSSSNLSATKQKHRSS